MTDILVMMATLVVAMCWIVYQQRVVDKLTKRLTSMDRRLNSARLTLTDAKREVDECLQENELLKAVLTDVAKGEAHVWIGEDGDVRATRTADRETPIH
jgi:hypothetical protein